MSFFDKLKASANSAAAAAKAASEVAVKQTKTLAAIGRVKVAIATEEDKAKKAYTELGKLYYRDFTAQAEQNLEEYLPFCEKAKDALEQVERLKAELEKLKAEETEEPVPSEDPAIFADFEETADDDSIEVEVYVVEDETPAEEPAPEVVVVDEAPAEETPSEEATAEEPPVQEPQVGTLYIDVTDQE